MNTVLKIFVCCILSLSTFSLKAGDTDTNILPFGLKYGMDTLQVNAIMDSLRACHKVVDHDELGPMYIFENERRIRIINAFDPNHGFSCIELTTSPIYGEFREARLKELKQFLKEQGIIIDKKHLTPDKNGYLASHCDIDNTSRIFIYGGLPSITFYHSLWEHDTNARIINRKYNGTYKDPEPLNFYQIFLIILSAIISSAVLWAAISKYIKKRKGLPHEIETGILKLTPYIIAGIIVIPVLAAILDSLVGFFIVLLCFLAFGKEIFKR